MESCFSKVLTIAGSDSIGGAGIQADIKAINHFGIYATTAITAVTAQDLDGVYKIHYVPIDVIKDQIEVVLKNGIQVVKIGMLGNAEIATVVYDVLSRHGTIKIVLDPVLAATSGATLLTDDAIAIIKSYFIPRSYIITPNIPEAETLLNLSIKTIEDMIDAAQQLSKLGDCAVLLKGGHMFFDDVFDDHKSIHCNEYCNNIVDVFVDYNSEVRFFVNERIKANTHGTGCALSAAIAALIAKGTSLHDAIKQSITYVREKIHADSKIFNRKII